MEATIPTISLPPPYSNEMSPANPLRAPTTYQTTTNTNLPDTAAMMSRIFQHPNTTVNLTNSSDVVIGPMTQFNERVTIYQYMDATLNHQQHKPGIDSGDNKPLQFKFSLRKHWLNILAICAIVLGLSTTIYFIFYTDNTPDPRPPIVFDRNYDSDTFPNLGGHYIIDREKWGALEDSKLQKNLTTLKHPIKYVVVGHMGVQTKPCFNIYTCSVKMRSVQDNAIGNKRLLDMSANFYFGGDGNIYTGRGWDYENAYGDKSLSLQFLGDFMRFEVEDKQFEAMQYLLNYGRTMNYLSRDYKLFGLNQTGLSKYSPGVNVFKRIKNLPRFYMCGEEGFETCGKDIDINWNIDKNKIPM